MIALGIDPGLARCGYGLVEKQRNGKLNALDYGIIETSSKLADYRRLALIYEALCAIVVKHKPQIMAVEKLFFNKNTRTAISVSQARGVVLLSGAIHNVPLAEYTPLQVKQAVTGEGRAEKQQVEYMVRILLSIRQAIKPDDVADALAVAISALHYQL